MTENQLDLIQKTISRWHEYFQKINDQKNDIDDYEGAMFFNYED